MVKKMIFVHLLVLLILHIIGCTGDVSESEVADSKKETSELGAGDIWGIWPGLAADTEIRIRQDYFNDIGNLYLPAYYRDRWILDYDYSHIKVDDVCVAGYYGTYNNHIAIRIHVFNDNRSNSKMKEQCIIDGNEFYFHKYEYIGVWKNGRFYTLQEAYDSGLLLPENIRSIHELYYHPDSWGTHPGLEVKTEQQITLDGFNKYYPNWTGSDEFLHSIAVLNNTERGDNFQVAVLFPHKYIGTFNGYIIFTYGASSGSAGNPMHTISGYTFGISRYDFFAWQKDENSKSGRLCTVQDAFDFGYLLVDDIKNIHKSFYRGLL